MKQKNYENKKDKKKNRMREERFSCGEYVCDIYIYIPIVYPIDGFRFGWRQLHPIVNCHTIVRHTKQSSTSSVRTAEERERKMDAFSNESNSNMRDACNMQQRRPLCRCARCASIGRAVTQAAKTSIAWNAWSVKEFASLLVVCADNNNRKIGVHNLFSYRAEGSTAHTGRVRLLLEQKIWSTHTDDDVDMYERTKEKS